MKTQDKETAKLILGELLNDAKIYERLAEVMQLQLDYDSQVFHEIENFIINKLDEMQK